MFVSDSGVRSRSHLFLFISLLGWSAFFGVAIMIFSISLNAFVARFLKEMQEKQMKHRDRRTSLMNELLANIKRYVLF